MRPDNAKERSIRRWIIAMRILRPLSLLLFIIAFIAAAPARIPLFFAMAAGDVLLDSSGNVVLDSNGNVRLAGTSDTNCTCPCSCWACTSCTDTPPGAYIATLAGATALGPGCFSCLPGSNSSVSGVSSPNGTWTCPCQVAACGWQYSSIAPYVTGTAYVGNSTCSAGARNFNDGITVQITKTSPGGIKSFTVSITCGEGHTFNSNATAYNTCDDPGGYSLSNTCISTSCGCLATGGTVTLTPA